MRVGLQGALADPGQQLVEGRIARQVTAQDQAVDEEADQRLDLRPVAVGDRRAHGRSSCPDRRSSRVWKAARRTMNRVASRRRASRDSRARDSRRSGGELPRAPRWSRTAGRGRSERQVERSPERRPAAGASRTSCRSSSSPESHCRCQTAKSAYWNGQLGQRRRRAGAGGRIERGDLADQHSHRPAVRDDVVHGEEQGVVGRRRGAAAGRAAAAPREVERPDRLLPGQAPGLRETHPSGKTERSTSGRVHRPGGEMTCTGWPSRSWKVVRRASCRRTTSPRTPPAGPATDSP